MTEGIRSAVRLTMLSARLIATRWYWAIPPVMLVWPLLLIVILLLGDGEAYQPVDVHWVLGWPLILLGGFFGVRIIAAEIDRRTLEIAYTVPGGSHRVWLYRLAAATLLMLITELLIAAVTAVFLTGFPPTALYGPLQAGVVTMVLAMALSTWFRSEIAGAMAVVPLVALGLMADTTRVSPFFNTLSSVVEQADPSLRRAWILQNRIGFLVVAIGLTLLAFSRSERREKMMS